MSNKWLIVCFAAACIGIAGSFLGGVGLIIAIIIITFIDNSKKEKEKLQRKISEIQYDIALKTEHAETQSNKEINALNINSDDLTEASKEIHPQTKYAEEKTEVQKIIEHNTGVTRYNENANTKTDIASAKQNGYTEAEFPYLRIAKAKSIQRGWIINLTDQGVVIKKGSRKIIAKTNDELISIFN